MSNEIKNKYKDALAMFLIKHVPAYSELPTDALSALENVWDAIGDNRTEFLGVLNNLRKTRKKRVDCNC